MFSAGLPAILPELVQAVSASTVTTVATTAAGAEALLACERLEAMLVPSDGRLDINGDNYHLFTARSNKTLCHVCPPSKV